MIRDVNLYEYLPPVVQDYKEIKAVVTAENPELQLVVDETEVLMNNQFIETTDTNGIKRYEAMLRIKALDDDALTNRQFKVLSVWNNAIPYTLRSLKEKLTILCGEDGYTLLMDHNAYLIKIRVALTSKKNYSQVERMLNDIIPSNMTIDASLLYNQYEALASYTHAQLLSYTHDQLRNEVL